jgi:hypothetical protein
MGQKSGQQGTGDTIVTIPPLPWKVQYGQRFADWDAKSCPYIVDANGNDIGIGFRQNQCHPGVYDEHADHIAHLIVNAINTQEVQP